MKEWNVIDGLASIGLDRQALENDIAYNEQQNRLNDSGPDIPDEGYKETLSQLRASGDRNAFEKYVSHINGGRQCYSETGLDMLWDAYDRRIERKSHFEGVISDDPDTTYRDLKREKDENTPKIGILKRLFG